MIRKTNIFMVLMLTLAWAAAVAAVEPAGAKPADAKPRPPRAVDKLKFAPLNPVADAKVVRDSLPNGLKILMVEDRDLPRVDFLMQVKGGTLAEPPGRAALSEMFGNALRTGGTEKMSGDDMDAYLERIGAFVESGASVDSFTVRGQALTEHLDKVLPALADLVRRPAFEQKKVDLAKTQMRSMIARRNDQVMGIAQREFAKLIYGAKSPYARQVEYDDVNAVAREDLVVLHRRCFRPDASTIAVWGDFKTAEMKEKLAKLFGDWKAEGPKPEYKVPDLSALSFSVNYIEKKDVEQTFILFGLPGLRYDDPDYPAVRVMSDILGGGFASRIFKAVRTEKGLAYSAGGYMSPDYDHKGVFAFFTSTKPSTTYVAISTIMEQFKSIRDGLVTDAELSMAKNSYLNSYAFEFDSKAKIITRLMTYDFYGYPADFNAKVRFAVEKVTKEDVQRVARKYLLDGQLTLLAVGKAAEFDKPLSELGKVNTIDITIPEAKSAEEIPAPTPQSLAEGASFLKKLAEARGGAAIASVKDLSMSGSMSAETPMGMMDMKFKARLILPDKMRNDITTPMGEMVMVADGDSGWMQFGGRTMALPGSQMQELKVSRLTEMGCMGALRMALNGELEAQSTGKCRFENQDAACVVVRPGGKAIRLYLTPDASSILGTRMTTSTQEGPAEITTVYSNLKTFDGVVTPTESQSKKDGKVIATTRIESVEINRGIDASVFAKPADAEAGAK